MSEPAEGGHVEHTLDPDDWNELRALGHRMVDDILRDMRTLREQPVWRPVPQSARDHLRAEVPLEPEGATAAYEQFREHVAPYPRGNNHPRYWGWVNGTGLPLGALADLLASAMNPSVASFESAANLVEEQVLGWLKSMLGFPAAFSAVLTSGSSMSNIIALAVARDARADFDVRRHGLAGSNARLVLYGSLETHSSLQKAAELLGLGADALRLVPTDADFRVDVAQLERAIATDRSAGLRPFCVVGNVGTVNTGAVDDLHALANLCSRSELWLHLDGAFGALAWLCPEMRGVLGPLQRADSLAFDLHKWMYLPYDVGCVFVRDAAAHRATFAVTPSYLSASPAGGNGHATRFPDYGIELSRRFRALKVWMCLKEHGVRRFEDQVRQNIGQAHDLERAIRALPNLELAAPVALNIVCFRFVEAGLSPRALDECNLAIVARIQEGGRVFASHTRLHERVVIRVAVTNHRSQAEDFRLLVQEIERHGRELRAPAAQHNGAAPRDASGLT
ncbi:MAG: aminotransferase class V-fold PLP-dependent enzyme [bacterium]|nr:aminotransferase class V-fold PLP-dependent enzyme [bacterium]